MFPIAFGITRDQFPREKISIGQGVVSSMFAAGAAIGLSIGAFIVQIFWLACNILHNNTYLHFTSDYNMAICLLK